MTDLSAADAERLANLRRSADEWRKMWPHEPEDRDEFYLRLLDAKPAGEFVTRATHDALKTDRDNWQQAASVWMNDAHDYQKRAEAAEAERDNWRRGLELWMTEAKHAWAKHQSVTAERDRLAAALATAQARIETMRTALHDLVEWVHMNDFEEDQHIMAAAFEALTPKRSLADQEQWIPKAPPVCREELMAALAPATGTGALPATEKGTAWPASDTGTSGPSGLHPAPAPSDYEAVCGSCGRPQP